MFPKLPLALALLLSAASAAELYTEVPYFMAPHVWAFGGGVAPAAVGNEECPSAVTLTPEISPGVPIIFSDPHSHGKSVAINDDKKVLIKFTTNVNGCQKRTWGNRFYVHMPKTVPIALLANATDLGYEPIYFKVRRFGPYYNKVYTEKPGDEDTEYGFTYYEDEANGFRRLAISTEKSDMLFVFNDAKDHYRMIESVV